jgi:hypothetical protein
VEAALTAWVLACRDAAAATAGQASLPRNERRRVLAIDGKNLRGARLSDGQQTKLLAVIDHTHRLVLTQTEVCDGNEIAAFITALDNLPGLRGCLVTADALHTQRGHADYLLGRGGHYLFTVTENQPTLHRALAALPWRAAPRDTEPGSPRGHGRIESRTATVIDLAGTGGRGGVPRCGPRHEDRPPPAHPPGMLERADPLRHHPPRRPAGRPGVAGLLGARALAHRGRPALDPVT